MFTQNIALDFLPLWNKQVHTETDFFKLCETLGIYYYETDLIACAGEYRVYRERPFILVHPFSDRRYKLWIQFHEMAHFISKHPNNCFDMRTTRKLDWEANIISSVALVPKVLFDKYMFWEIKELYDYPTELLLTRLKVLERLGI